MAYESSSHNKLEIILQDRSSGPQNVPLEYLRKITKDFSDKHLLGEGGFGKVYKGVLQNEKMIAVKKLEQLKPGVQDRQFENEVYHLMKLKHPNIVQFVGYCYETRNECVEYNGKHIFAEMQQRLLCLEYLPNGSLDRHLSDEYSGLDWHTRYRIIKGICHGLHYLHEECKCQINASIIHLDLKPANILLDENMVPKLADFGLSRLFGDKKTQTCTSTLAGSLGYMAPEYICARIITAKADMYSLGVIIVEIITGSKIDPFSFTTSCQDFVEPLCMQVLENWRNRLEAAPSETDCKQIKCCLEIGLSCLKINRDERPMTKEIIEMLNRWESTNGYVNYEKLPADKDANRNTLHQYAQDPSDRHAEQMYHGSRFQKDIVGATPSNYFEENPGTGDSQLYRHDNQEYSADGDPLPGIEGFQIVGEPRPGSTLRACGFPTNGTTLCNFQWVRYHEDGTRQSIEGAMMYDYVVTADDIGTLLAVDCTPMDDNGRQGDLVREFANNENKITCDPEMQNEIDLYISNGRADFDVFVLQAYFPEEWVVATLVLRRPGYQIKFKHTGEVVIDEKYSPNLQTKIPNGRTKFVLVSSGGVNLPFNTQGIMEPNNEDYDVRLRDLIVLVMRTFQNKALDAKRKGKV